MTAIRGQRVLITGAGHGLGRALAERFAAGGAEVVATDRDAALVPDGYEMDVTRPERVLAVRDRVLAERGPIDVLVNNAGVVYGGPFEAVPEEKHRLTVAVNVAGLVTVTHAFWEMLLARPAAHLVNVASAAATVALPNGASYAASKWAVLGFGESLREELWARRRRNVGVTTICPSYIDTGLFAGAEPPKLSRLLRTADVAAAVVRAVERNRETLFLPWSVGVLYGLSGAMPRWLYRRVCRRLGVSRSMDGWRGPTEEKH